MDFHTMRKKLENIGYCFTGEYRAVISGKRRRLYRIDFRGGAGLRKLSPSEIRAKIPGISVFRAAPEYAKELSFLLVYGRKI